MRMNKRVVEQVYDNVNVLLWAILIAALVFFGIFVAPKLPKEKAKYEATHALEIASENDFYCRKWGMAPGNANYRGCMLDLQDLRAKVERRIDDKSLF